MFWLKFVFLFWLQYQIYAYSLLILAGISADSEPVNLKKRKHRREICPYVCMIILNSLFLKTSNNLGFFFAGSKYKEL